MRIDKLIEFIEALLMQKADVEYAEKMSSYMKGKFSFYGVRAPERNTMLKEIKLKAKSIDIDCFIELAHQCWQLDQREYQYIAIDLLKWRKKKLTASHLPDLEKLIISKSWWDSVDGIAPNLVGEILSTNKELQYKWTEKWIASDDIWLRRSAIIHQLRYKSAVDEDLLFALIESQIGSKEFFINKACGWALRQYGKFNPVSVKQYLELHPTLSGLTVREASRYI